MPTPETKTPTGKSDTLVLWIAGVLFVLAIALAAALIALGVGRESEMDRIFREVPQQPDFESPQKSQRPD